MLPFFVCLRKMSEPIMSSKIITKYSSQKREHFTDVHKDSGCSSTYSTHLLPPFTWHLTAISSKFVRSLSLQQASFKKEKRHLLVLPSARSLSPFALPQSSNSSESCLARRHESLNLAICAVVTTSLSTRDARRDTPRGSWLPIPLLSALVLWCR